MTVFLEQPATRVLAVTPMPPMSVRITPGGPDFTEVC